MNTIWKFEIVRPANVYGIIPVEDVPMGVRWLSVQVQNTMMCLWGEVDPAASKFNANVCLVGTGHEIPDEIAAHGLTFLGTAQQDGFVWHVYA